MQHIIFKKLNKGNDAPGLLQESVYTTLHPPLGCQANQQNQWKDKNKQSFNLSSRTSHSPLAWEGVGSIHFI